MSGMHAELYAIAFALSAFSTGVLGARRACANRPIGYFQAYFGLESAGFALELLVAHPDSPYKSLWLALLMASSLLTAPCLWMAVREAISGERPRLADLLRGHFLIVALGAVMVLPLLAAAHGGPEWAGPVDAVRPWHFHVIHHGMVACMIVFAFQVPFYLRRARRLLAFESGATVPRSLPQRAWLHLPLITVGTTWMLGMLRTVRCATHGPTEWGTFFALIDVSVTVGVLFLVLRREVVRQALERVDTAVDPEPESAVVDIQEPEASVTFEPTPARVKYAGSRLDPLVCARIRRRLDEAITGRALHRDSRLSLPSLCAAISEKPHAVSQFLNQELGLTFYDWVNRHRIDDARGLMRADPARTVLELAFAVGFNSKSTFNAAFRRFSGMTPSAYRTTLGEDPT